MFPSNQLLTLESSYSEPPYRAPAFNIIPPIEHTNLGPKKYFYSYSYVGYIEKLGIEHDFYQSPEIHNNGV